jgi:AcrR family transcriptional regulator
MARLRRTQEERTAAMRARLLAATVATLFERGYARTTTTEIVRRARVSRGAQLHHFPTKAELVTTAVEHLFAQRTEEFRAAFADTLPGADRVAGAIDLLWSMLSGPTFYAWLELVVAARTDSKLRRTVAGVAARFVEAVRATFHALFPEPDAAVVPGFAFALLQGLAVDRIVVPEAPHIASSIEGLKLLGRLLMPQAEVP